MDILKTIRDKDLGINTPAPAKRHERNAGRALIFDLEKKIALLHVVNKKYHKLPGGGAKKGESIIQTMRRELREEVGCEIKNVKELGIIEEFRDRFSLHQFSYCFIGDLLGDKRLPSFEQEEINDGFEPIWLNLDEAIKLLESETKIEDYEGKFIQVRDLVFLKEARKYLNSQK
jgi:8-oxo-dGTP pyrophosphatase MutT (NUDIX family)